MIKMEAQYGGASRANLRNMKCGTPWKYSGRFDMLKAITNPLMTKNMSTPACP